MSTRNAGADEAKMITKETIGLVENGVHIFYLRWLIISFILASECISLLLLADLSRLLQLISQHVELRC